APLPPESATTPPTPSATSSKAAPTIVPIRTARGACRSVLRVAAPYPVRGAARRALCRPSPGRPGLGGGCSLCHGGCSLCHGGGSVGRASCSGHCGGSG